MVSSVIPKLTANFDRDHLGGALLMANPPQQMWVPKAVFRQMMLTYPGPMSIPGRGECLINDVAVLTCSFGQGINNQ